MANPLYGQNKLDDQLSQKDVDGNNIHAMGQGIIIPGSTYSESTNYGNADPYVEHSSAQFPLGSWLTLGDRVFRYGGISSAGAVSAGKVVQQPVLVANHSQMTATATTAVGATAISVETQGDTDLTADEYNEGYLSVNDSGAGTGEGQFLKVKDHPAHDHSDDASVIITTYDPLITALTTGSQLTLIYNPYSNCIVAPTGETGAVVGVTNIDMSASYFGWFQVRGPRCVLIDGSTLVLGHRCLRSDNVAGAVMADNSDDLLPQVGQVMGGSVVATEYGNILLNIC